MNATGVTPGTYSSVTVTADGRVTSGSGTGTASTITDGSGDTVSVGTSGGITFTVGNSVQGNWSSPGLMIGSSKSALDKLDVFGGVAIGTSYAGITTAPTNGLAVQGSVAIGTTATNGALNVNGTITATSFSGSGAGLTGVGSGTVGSGSAGQVAYFQSTGTAVIGTSAITISNGNVGVGTASPHDPLEVNGSVRFANPSGGSNFIETAGVASDGRMKIQDSSGNALVQINGTCALAGIGIGSGNACGSAFYSYAGNTAYLSIALNQGINAIGSYGGQSGVLLGNSDSGNSDVLRMGLTGGNADAVNNFFLSTARIADTLNSPDLSFAANNINFYSGINSNARTQGMIINRSGNVGIGTTTPTKTLQVVGSYDLTDSNGSYIRASGGYLDLSAGNGALRLLTATVGVGNVLSVATPVSFGTGYEATRPILQIGDGGFVGATGNFASGYSGGTWLGFNTATGFSGGLIDAQVAGVRKFSVKGTGDGYFGGNVGIGTATPQHALDVNGNIGLAAGKYINFGSTDGATGYGIFDNAGTLQYKNSGGSWTNLGSGGGSGLTIATSAITGGTTTKVLYDNAGVLGEYTISGTGNVVMSASPTLTGTVAGASSTWSSQVAIGTTALSGALNVNGTVTATAFSGSGASLTGIGTSALGGITGTPSSTTYLRGDGTWAAPASSLPSLASASIWVGNASNVATAVAPSGDCTISNAGAITCTKTGGTAFSALATAASVNLSTQASGTLQAAQEPSHTGDVTNTAGSLALTVAKIAGVAVGTPTGTGNVVMSASPTLTGTVAGASSTWSSQVAIGTTALSGALNVNGTATATAFSGSGASLTGIGTSALGGITGTPSSSNYLRGDGTWAIPSGGSITGTGVANQVPYWSSTTALSNDSGFTYAGSGAVTINGAATTALSSTTSSTTGIAIRGISSATTGSTLGGYFTAASTSGTALEGNNTSTGGYGVLGSGQTGVEGYSWNSSSSSNSIGVYGSAGAAGGTRSANLGVYGYSITGGGTVSANYGVFAYGATGGGVSTSNYGVYAVAAVSGGTGANTYGVYGYTAGDGSSSNYGIYGDAAGSAIGGYFTSASGYALITGTGKAGFNTAIPQHALDVNGNIGLAAGKYINFGSTDGATGYGIFDNAGTLQYKHSGGSWTNFGSGGGSGLTVATSAITGGATTKVLYDNAGVLGEYTISGTGNVVMSASPTLTGTVAGASSTWSSQVAIGTTALSGALNVNGTATATAFSGSGASLTGIGTSALGGITGTPSSTTYLRGDGTWATPSGGSSQWTTSGSNIYYTTGKVGIGTINPLWDLSVIGTAGAPPFSVVATNDFSLASAGTALALTTGATSGNTYGQIQVNTGGGTTAGNLVIAPFGGNVGIGVTTPVGLQVNASTNETVQGSANVRLGVAGGTPRLQLDNASTIYEIDNSSGTLRFFNPGVVRATLDGSGNFSSANCCSSDMRLKSNITDISDAVGLLQKMRPVRYAWINPKLHGDKESGVGFLAQDVEKLFPNEVYETEASGPDVGLVKPGKTSKALKQSFVLATTAYLVEAVKELKSIFDADHDELAKLKADNDNLRRDEDEKIRKLEAEIEQLKAAQKGAK